MIETIYALASLIAAISLWFGIADGWRRLRSLNKRAKYDNKLQWVYTDKRGNKYYTYKNILEMSVTRLLLCNNASETAKFNIHMDEFRQVHKEMRDAANAGELTVVFAKLNELEARVFGATDERLLLELSATYFIRGDEDAIIPNPEINRQKIKNWETDVGATAFFLNGAWAFLLQLTNSYNGTIPNVSEIETEPE